MASDVEVRLLSFGPWKELFAVEGEPRRLPAGALVADLLSRLTTEGRLTPTMATSAAVAVNENLVVRTHELLSGDVVAVLPPVSGGKDRHELVVLTRACLDISGVQEAIKAGEDGAVVTFDGIVRNESRGRQTLYLDYEAYEPMALRQMRVLREEAIARFAVREIAIHHRLGRLLVGESSVLIVVASAHRQAAFEACRWVIDALKTTVPIWKHEQFVDGAKWVEGEPFPQHLSGRGDGSP